MPSIKTIAKRSFASLTEQAHARADPTGAGRLHRLRQSVHGADYHVHVLPPTKTIYIEVSKAACTSIKLLLSESLHGPFALDALDIHKRAQSRIPTISDVGARRFFALVDDPDTLIFTFVRNPYARIVSCYRNKLERHALGARRALNRDLRSYFGPRLDSMDPAKPLSFAHFVEMACATSRTGKNGHWLAMDRLLPKDDVVCRFVGRVENYDADIKSVCARLNVQPRARRHNSSGAVRLSDWIGPDIRDAIMSAYREDFERFEYSTAVPD